MRAVVITKPGGPEVLKIQELADPKPGPGQVRVKVHATAVNRADILQTQGLYPAPKDSPADIPGLEFAGVIDALGEGVQERNVGDRVFGLLGSGAYADYIVTNARALAVIPESLSFAQAAAIPEAFITAYDAIVLQGGLSSGDYCLISACGSGVGTAAIQIANVIGAQAIGTSRTADKLDEACKLGLKHPICVPDGNFADQVLEITNGLGADVVLELVGGAYIEADLKCTRQRGRIIVVGLLAGARCNFDLALLLRKRLQMFGTVLRSRPLEEKIIAHQEFAKHLVPHFESGKLKVVIDRELDLADVADAYSYVQNNQNFGKVVLRLA